MRTVRLAEPRPRPGGPRRDHRRLRRERRGEEGPGAVARQVEEYRRHGFEVVGLVGINGSPSCGVETSWRDDEEVEGPGVFTRTVAEAVGDQPLRMVGIKASAPQNAVEQLEKLLMPRGG